MKIKALANNEAELLIYGYIGDWENDSADIAKAIKDTKADTLRVRINSGGGSLLDGIAIYHAIRKFNGKKIVEIDALAASAASIIAMAGDERIMPKSTFMMIHNSSGWAGGNADDFAKTAELLESLDKTMAELYVQKTGQTFEAIKQMMDEETWLSAEQALELGFATSIVDDAQEIAASFDENGFVINGAFHKNVPEAIKQKIQPAKAVVNNVNLVKGTKTMDIQAFEREHPDLYKQVEAIAFEKGKAEGITAERQRIKAIEEIGIAGHEQLTIDAKFVSGITPEALAMKVLAAEKAQKTEFLAHRQNDASELNNIALNIQPTANNQEQEFLAVFDKGVE